MLAYTTLFDLFYMPSGLEVVVYMAGLIAMLTLPSILFGMIENRSKKEQTDSKPSRPSA